MISDCFMSQKERIFFIPNKLRFEVYLTKKGDTSWLKMNYWLSLIENAIMNLKDHIKHFNSIWIQIDLGKKIYMYNITFGIFFISRK